MITFYQRIFGALFGVLTIVTAIRAQPQSPNLTPELGSVLLPTPNAASLGRYVEQPVSQHTGLPAINVPLWQLKRGDIAVDVGLSYHGGGIKVDELASWVGIGWSLQGAGMVTRTARGLPDNIGAFRQFDLPRLTRYFTHTMTPSEEKDFLYQVYTGVFDTEPDLYTVSAPGISCQFYMGADGEYVTIPRDANLLIQSNARIGQEKMYTWLITDGRGVQYKFWTADESTTTYTSPGNSGFPSSEYTGETSWMLDQIEDTKGNRMQFTYASEGTNFSTIASERFSYSTTKISDCIGKTNSNYTWSSTAARAQRLVSITNGLEQLRFIPRATDRLDARGTYSLERVEVAYGERVMRRFRLFTSYWSANGIGTRGTYYPDAQNASRLRLDSLREESGEGALTKPPTSFTYEPGDLPFRGSAAQDHWGYSNGQDNRTRVSYTMGGQKAGANKEPNPAYSKAGLLTSIRHPTGGTTEFLYEPNRYVRSTSTVAIDSALVEGLLAGDQTGVDFYESFPFEITPAINGPAGTDIALSFDISASNYTPGQPMSGFTYSFGISRRDGTSVAVVLTRKGNVFTGFLPPGSYSLGLSISKDFAEDPFVLLQATIVTQITRPGKLVEHLGPGLRIKQITQQASGQLPLIHTYDYNDPGVGFSSGQFGGAPSYQSTINYHGSNNLGDGTSYTYTCSCEEFTSTSKYPLFSTQGSYMGYSYVTEYTSQGKTNGKRTYQFTNFDLFNDINNQTAFPYEPASPRAYLRGLTLGNQTWAQPSGQPITLVQTDSIEYDYLPSSVSRAYGLKVGLRDRYEGAGGSMWPAGAGYSTQMIAGMLTISKYPLESSSYQVVTKRSAQYAGTQRLQQRSTYAYTPDLFQVRRISTRTNSGDTQVQRFYYPSDYPTTSPLIDALTRAHRLTVPLETSQLLLPATGSSASRVPRLITGVVHRYSLLPTSASPPRLFLSRLYAANTSLADTSQHFTGELIPAFYEEKARVTQVTAHGEPMTQMLNRQNITATLWDVEERYPLAQCQNARSDEVFYEGFEQSATASTAAAYAGRYGAANAYTVQWTPPNTRAYQLRYRYRTAGRWLLRQQPYAGPGTPLVGGDAYDDVSVYPRDAQLTTYTYEPLVGATSQTGPDGRTTFYEYDGLGRLIRTRDEQGRILSQQQYHYAQH
jgi:YD repeat-containing protein